MFTISNSLDIPKNSEYITNYCIRLGIYYFIVNNFICNIMVHFLPITVDFEWYLKKILVCLPLLFRRMISNNYLAHYMAYRSKKTSESLLISMICCSMLNTNAPYSRFNCHQLFINYCSQCIFYRNQRHGMWYHWKRLTPTVDTFV